MDNNKMELDKLEHGKIHIGDEWLGVQRSRLMGAIDQIESKKHRNPFRHIDRFEKKYNSAMIIITGIAAVFIGILIGTWISVVAGDREVDINELIQSGRISKVRLISENNNPPQYEFIITKEEDFRTTGNLSEEQMLELLYHAYLDQGNPALRQQLASSMAEVDDQLTIHAVSKALLTEKDPRIQQSLLREMSKDDEEIVKETLIAVVMGDYPDGTRLTALKDLGKYLSDIYIRQMLSIVAVTDKNNTLREHARDIIIDYSSSAAEVAK